MTARELVVTYLATLAAIVVVVAGLAALVAGLPSIAGAVGGAVGGVTDAGGAFLDGLAGGQSADLSGDVGDDEADAADGGSDGTDTEDAGGTSDGGAGDGSDGDADGTDDGDDTDDAGGTDDGGDTDDAGDGTDSGTTDGGSDGGAETDGAVVDDGNGSEEDVEHERPDVEAIQAGLVEAINDHREANYVPDLDSIYVDELWTIADEHTGDMVEHGYVGNEAPDGETSTDRFERHDPRCDRVNDYDDALALAVRINYSTVVSDPTHDDTAGLVDRMMAEWRGDAGLLDDDYDDVGVSVRHDNASDSLYGAVAAC